MSDIDPLRAPLRTRLEAALADRGAPAAEADVEALAAAVTEWMYDFAEVPDVRFASAKRTRQLALKHLADDVRHRKA